MEIKEELRMFFPRPYLRNSLDVERAEWHSVHTADKQRIAHTDTHVVCRNSLHNAGVENDLKCLFNRQ